MTLPHRDDWRNKRPREQRARSTNVKDLARVVRLPVVYPDVQRPLTRGDCANVPRPCPWVSCRHHLYLDVLDTGSLKLNFPDLEPHELKHSCSLDMADRGPTALHDVGAEMNITRERVRQLEVKALDKVGRIRRVLRLDKEGR